MPATRHSTLACTWRWTPCAAVIVGNPDLRGVVPVRVHSSCLTGDLFGSLKCDCGDQLRRALRTLKELGGGILLYLDQEGRGTGIAAKMRAYGYQHEGLDTIDADAQLGFGADERRYGSAIAMLRGLGVQRIQLLTNNPTKVQHLRNAEVMLRETARVGRIGIGAFPNFAHWPNRLSVLRGRMPVTRRLPYQWYDTPNIRVGTYADFEVLARSCGLRVEDSFGLSDGEVIRRWPNLLANTAVFKVSN